MLSNIYFLHVKKVFKVMKNMIFYDIFLNSWTIIYASSVIPNNYTILDKIYIRLKNWVFIKAQKIFSKLT